MEKPVKWSVSFPEIGGYPMVGNAHRYPLNLRKWGTGCLYILISFALKGYKMTCFSFEHHKISYMALKLK